MSLASIAVCTPMWFAPILTNCPIYLLLLFSYQVSMLHKEEAGLTVDRSLDGAPADVQTFQVCYYLFAILIY